MKFLLVLFLIIVTNLVWAKSKTVLRVPASVESQNIACTVRDGKEDSEVKTISKKLKKSDTPSIDETIGDFRIMAQWVPAFSGVSVGVIEEKSSIVSSTVLLEKNKVGNLFVAKNGQTVDLNCYFN